MHRGWPHSHRSVSTLGAACRTPAPNTLSSCLGNSYKDDSDKFYPSGGTVVNEDPVGLRTGQAPQDKLREVIKKTIAEARAAVHKNLTKQNVKMTMDIVQENLDRLRGAVMIVYPMGLPPYDEVQACLDDKEELGGRQAGKEVIPSADLQLWWAGKELQRGKALHQFVGKNEKTKIVVKIQRRGAGAPVREPVVDEETQRQMMAYAHKKQEEWKKLEASEEDSYLNSAWADTSALKNSLQGTSGIKWR